MIQMMYKYLVYGQLSLTTLWDRVCRDSFWNLHWIVSSMFYHCIHNQGISLQGHEEDQLDICNHCHKNAFQIRCYSYIKNHKRHMASDISLDEWALVIKLFASKRLQLRLVQLKTSFNNFYNVAINWKITYIKFFNTSFFVKISKHFSFPIN
jgi:hypothetical protein